MRCNVNVTYAKSYSEVYQKNQNTADSFDKFSTEEDGWDMLQSKSTDWSELPKLKSK